MMHLEELLRDEVRVLSGVETRGGTALATLSRATTAPQARAEIDHAVSDCDTQWRRLDGVASSMGGVCGGMACRCLEGLDHICDVDGSVVCDAGVRDMRILSMARVILSYGRTRYECALVWARAIEHEMAVHLIEQSIEEKGMSISRLSELSDSVSTTDARPSVVQPLIGIERNTLARIVR